MSSAERERAHAAAFDPSRLDAAFYEDPYPTYAALRTWDPVHLCPDGSYFLTRFADLDQIYRDRTRLSSDKKQAFAPKFGADSPLYAHHTTSLVFNDAPYHTRVRRQILAALTPAVLKRMEPDIVALVDGLLDRLAARTQFDLIEEFAAAIPVEVIGNLLQVPRDERAPLRGWSLAILGALESSISAEQQLAGDRAVEDFSAYLRRLVAERRRHPGDDADLLTRLLQAQELSEWELLQNCVFLLNAGHETTTNLIGNALHLLMTHPQVLQQLREAPELIGSTVEECLRYESPNQLGNRLVIERFVVGRGVTLPAGAYLTLCIGAANRDPEEFPEAARFDIARKPNRHLAFAAGGHACAGMSVARLEAQIAILRMVQRFPGLKPCGRPLRSARARFRGFRSLPATIA
jgi:cytochrome P450